MKIKFKITDVPLDSQVTEIALNAYLMYLEGIVTITIDDMIFFESKGILLIEFARCIHSWLADKRSGLFQDFVYETMDFAEGPILAFKHIKDGLYEVDSIWKKNKIKALVDSKHIVAAFENYQRELDAALQEKIGIKLKQFYKKNF